MSDLSAIDVLSIKNIHPSMWDGIEPEAGILGIHDGAIHISTPFTKCSECSVSLSCDVTIVVNPMAQFMCGAGLMWVFYED